MKIQTPAYQNYYKKHDQFITAKGYKNNSKMYQYQVRAFLIWLENKGITKVKNITSAVMVEYLEYLNTRPNKRLGGTLSPSSIDGHLYSIAMFFDNLLEWKELKSVILLPKFKRTISEKARQILTEEEVQKLYANCQSKQEKAILSVAYGCGLRRAEMNQLELKDVSFSSGIMIVRNGKLNKRREVPLSDEVLKYLKDYVINERGFYLRGKNQMEPSFFLNNNGKRMSGETLNRRLKAIIERTNDSNIIEKNITLHCLRHSIATHLIENGAGIEFVRDFLGHENIDTSHLYAIRRKRNTNRLIQSYL